VTCFVLDTDICIYLLNHRPGYENILKHLDGRAYGQVILSAITLAELRFGIAASQRREANLAKLELFLASFETAPFAEQAAMAYGSIRAYLQAQGALIGPLDMLIAAHALSLKATLVTNNGREFSRVPGLSIENWLEPT
jgi:tRNA(fMet)-specific endonuclease VapC